MKIFKKLLSTVLASTMVVGMSVGAFADVEVDAGILDEPNIYDEEDSHMEVSSSRKPKRLRITKHKQEKSLWCWVAAVQMVADYETGDSSSQSSIVNSIYTQKKT